MFLVFKVYWLIHSNYTAVTNIVHRLQKQYYEWQLLYHLVIAAEYQGAEFYLEPSRTSTMELFLRKKVTAKRRQLFSKKIQS